MRIVHVTDCYRPRVGGIEVLVEGLAARQAAAGHHVEIWTTTNGRSGPGTVGSGLEDVGVRRLPALVGTAPGPATLRRLRRELLPGRFDVLHAHSSILSPLAWGAVRTAAHGGLPTVVTMHSMIRPGSIGLEWSQAVGWTRWPVGVTAVSHVAAAPLRALGVDVEILPNGVDTLWWQPPPALRNRRPAVTIVSVMRLAARKRPLPLIRMLARLRDIVPDDIPLRAVVIGDGPLRSRLAAELHRTGAAAWVELAGALTPAQVRARLHEADLYLAPADQESFGIAALEARCAGLPVIARSSGGVGEFVRHGRDGLLVGSDDEMVTGAAQLITSGQLGELQRHSLAAPPSDFAWPCVVERTLNCYRRVGAGIPPRPAHSQAGVSKGDSR
ncbi:glycosyltransferase family 4 protein [Spongisporangium articulatum]|uniref:Glycosyltransferase family 4 protein n=1 Tax=Spongisporangium articulatum TaxID=3362603 RepID=A0ABW8ARZ3_9ACTN